MRRDWTSSGHGTLLRRKEGLQVRIHPEQAQLSSPQTWNRYSYCLNNPLGFVDTNGEWPTGVHEWIVDHAFQGLSNDERTIIKKASKSVDYESGSFNPENAYKHGLRRSSDSVQRAAEKSDQWLNTNIDNAQNASNRTDSLKAFGAVFHLVTDETSPAHIGYQAWRGMNFVCPEFTLASWGLHYVEEMESIGFDYFHMGFAIAVAQRAYAETYGAGELNRATGGIVPGSPNDLVVKEIHQRFLPTTSLTDVGGMFQVSHDAEAAQALYMYNLGLARGRKFDYHHQSK